MTEQEKETTPPPEEKAAPAKVESVAAKKVDGAPAKKKGKSKEQDGKCKEHGGVKHATMIDKYFAAGILFSIFVVIVSGFGAGISFYEVFYRCVIITALLWAVSIAVRKYCSMLASFKCILQEMKKDSAVASSEE